MLNSSPNSNTKVINQLAKLLINSDKLFYTVEDMSKALSSLDSRIQVIENTLENLAVNLKAAGVTPLAMFPADRSYFTLTEVARMLGVSESVLRKEDVRARERGWTPISELATDRHLGLTYIVRREVVEELLQLAKEHDVKSYYELITVYDPNRPEPKKRGRPRKANKFIRLPKQKRIA